MCLLYTPPSSQSLILDAAFCFSTTFCLIFEAGSLLLKWELAALTRLAGQGALAMLLLSATTQGWSYRCVPTYTPLLCACWGSKLTSSYLCNMDFTESSSEPSILTFCCCCIWLCHLWCSQLSTMQLSSVCLLLYCLKFPVLHWFAFTATLEVLHCLQGGGENQPKNTSCCSGLDKWLCPRQNRIGARKRLYSPKFILNERMPPSAMTSLLLTSTQDTTCTKGLFIMKECPWWETKEMQGLNSSLSNKLFSTT